MRKGAGRAFDCKLFYTVGLIDGCCRDLKSGGTNDGNWSALMETIAADWYRRIPTIKRNQMVTPREQTMSQPRIIANRDERDDGRSNATLPS